MLACYSDYLIAQNHRATVTGLAKLMKGHISHDKVYRFLGCQDFSSKSLFRIFLIISLQRLKLPFVGLY